MEEDSVFSINIPAYNFNSAQRKDELIEDFKIRVQAELDELNIPVEVV